MKYSSAKAKRDSSENNNNGLISLKSKSTSSSSIVNDSFINDDTSTFSTTVCLTSSIYPTSQKEDSAFILSIHKGLEEFSRMYSN